MKKMLKVTLLATIVTIMVILVSRTNAAEKTDAKVEMDYDGSW